MLRIFVDMRFQEAGLTSSGLPQLLYYNRRADFGVLIKFLRQVRREANAAVRGCVTWEVSCMHANAVVEAQEVGHW